MISAAQRAVAVSVVVIGCSGEAETDRPGVGMPIRSAVTCATCRIVLDSVTTLPGLSSSGAVVPAVDPSGAFYVVDRDEHLLKAFAPDGTPRGVIGRHGGGPGEYEAIQNVWVTADGRLELVDPLLGRRSVFSLNGDFISSTPIHFQRAFTTQLVALGDGRILVNALRSLGNGTGHALQVFNVNGDLETSFDLVTGDPTSWRYQRHIVARRSGELLVGRPYSASIEVYDSRLTHVRTVVREIGWGTLVEPVTQPGDGVFEEPFTARVAAVWEDAQGLIRMRSTVPSPSWVPMRAPAQLDERARAALAARPRVETIIEVVDLERNEVIAMHRFDGPVGMAFGGGFIGSRVEDSAGEPGMRVSRFYLMR